MANQTTVQNTDRLKWTTSARVKSDILFANFVGWRCICGGINEQIDLFYKFYNACTWQAYNSDRQLLPVLGGGKNLQFDTRARNNLRKLFFNIYITRICLQFIGGGINGRLLFKWCSCARIRFYWINHRGEMTNWNINRQSAASHVSGTNKSN